MSGHSLAELAERPTVFVYVTWQRHGICRVTSVSRIRSSVQNLSSEVLSAAVDSDTVSAERSDFCITSVMPPKPSSA